ncbi:hypothetical protein ACHAWU_007001 [Discostella pseudostelligera]|uniref:Uncharacterized protein n=1 Tax=Discostella pseudostelligera TaxID=259834 RepID=A0ABD3N0P3_9STRA
MDAKSKVDLEFRLQQQEAMMDRLAHEMATKTRKISELEDEIESKNWEVETMKEKLRESEKTLEGVQCELESALKRATAAEAAAAAAAGENGRGRSIGEDAGDDDDNNKSENNIAYISSNGARSPSASPVKSVLAVECSHLVPARKNVITTDEKKLQEPEAGAAMPTVGFVGEDDDRPPALILRDYREAEIRHGRLAMLAAIIWPLQEILDRIFIPDSFGSTTVIYGGTTLPFTPLIMTFFMLNLGYLDIYSSEVKENVTGDAKRVKKDEDDVESAAV